MAEKILYLVPRILAVLAILFMGMFSLDSFGGSYSLMTKVLHFLMHNIPVFILIIFLAIAWRRELLGGILFIFASVAGFIFFKSFTGNPGSIIVITPFFLTGVLFLLHYYMYPVNHSDPQK
jgi:hypothetical protein